METNLAVTTEEFAEPAPPPAAPDKLTPRQIGQLRRMWITQTNGTVRACGHKDNFTKTDKREGKQPNNNCVYCWAAYFMTSVDLDFVHAVLTQKGVNALIAMKGTKFVRMFHGFIAGQLLPALAAETKEEPTEEPAKITGGTFGNGTAGNEVQTASITE